MKVYEAASGDGERQTHLKWLTSLMLFVVSAT